TTIWPPVSFVVVVMVVVMALLSWIEG
ncbi:MAG: hypothetical protein QOF88_5610, partial [Mycobacterium sp.]|nr:hypothetical protein [Mycobacterium sp.]